MIGIITLFSDEFRLLKDNSLIEDSRKIGEFRFYTGEIGSHRIAFVHCIPDQITLSAATQAMVDHYSPRLIIVSSAAETLVPFIDTGDIIIANYFVIPEMNNSFDSSPNWPKNRMIETDSNIIGSLRTAADALGDRDPQTVFGSIISAGENDLKSPRLKNMTRKMGVMAADPSGSAIASISSANGIPCIVTEMAYLSTESLEKYLNSEASARTVEKLFNLKLIALTELTRSRSFST